MNAEKKITQTCKACGGQGSHRSNISKTMIKCPRCRGTGSIKKE